MIEIIGIIESKKLGKSGFGAFGQWQVYEFQIDGKRYSTFEKSIYDAHNVGQTVKITGENTPKGFNMKKMEVTDQVKTIAVGQTTLKPQLVLNADVLRDIADYLDGNTKDSK